MNALEVDGTNWYAGTADSGIYRSTDNGAHWAKASTGLDEFSLCVYTFALYGGNLWAGTSSGTYVSTDAGESWTGVNAGLPRNTFDRPFPVKAFALVPIDGGPEALFAGTYSDDPTSGVFRYMDGSATWAHWGGQYGNPGRGEVTALLGAPEGTGLYAGTENDGVYYLADSSALWTAMNTGLHVPVSDYGVSSLATVGTDFFVSENGDFGPHGGIWHSVDSCHNWSRVLAGLPDGYFYSFAVSGTSLYVGADSGVWVTSDKGAGWARVGSELDSVRVQTVFASGSTLYAGTVKGVYAYSLEPGSLTIKLADAASQPGPGTRGRVDLYSGSGVRVAQANADDNSRVTFSGLTPGTGYFYSAFATVPSPWEEEFWGKRWDVAIGPGQTTSDTFIHWTPYISAVSVIVDSTNEHLSAGSMRMLYPGTRLRVEAQVKNPSYPGSADAIVSGRLYLDRDRTSPYDATVTTDPQSMAVGTSKTLVFYWVAPDAVGSYSISVGVLATAGSYLNRLTDVIGWQDPVFRVAEPPPVLPVVLVSPSHGSLHQPVPTVLRWNAFTGALSCIVQLAGDSTFNAGLLVNDSTLTDTSHSVASLANGTMYFWRVRAKKIDGMSAFSPVWSFTTALALPTQVQLVRPLADAIQSADSVTLVWQKAAPGVTSYWVEIASDSLFVSRTSDSTVTDTSSVRHGLLGGWHWWRVRAHNESGWGPYSASRKLHVSAEGVEVIEGMPKEYVLRQNYPNPFNPATVIVFDLPKASVVSLRVYNTIGQEVATLVEGETPGGTYRVNFDGSGLASGVYLFRLQAGDFVATRKMMLVK